MLRLQLTPSLLGQSRRLCSDPVGRSLPSRFVLVARSRSSPGGCLAGPGNPRPRLLVQHLGLGLGCASRRGGCFQPVVSGGRLLLDQCSGALSGGAWSTPLSPSDRWLHGHHLHQQLHGLPPELAEWVGGGGGATFSVSQRDCSAHSSLGRVLPHRSGPFVYHGSEQCPC